MEADLVEELRLRLEEALSLHGLSQLNVAERSGIGQGTLSRFLGGKGISEENQAKLTTFLDGLGEAPVPSSDEVRRAIRLYRYVRNLSEQGTTLILKESDGTERALLILW